MTLFLLFKQQGSLVVAMASVRIKEAKNWQKQKKTYSNTAPTAQTLSILSISDARSILTMKRSLLHDLEYYNVDGA